MKHLTHILLACLLLVMCHQQKNAVIIVRSKEKSHFFTQKLAGIGKN